MKYDLIIIGSGSVGAAAGYYATRAGLKVLMTDAHMPPHQQGSHHGDTRLIRHAYGEGEKYVPLVLRAQALWMNSPHTMKSLFLSAPASLTSARPTPLS
ncbi:N-methyltryptophan oxidase [Salmonella enterica subsp. enterica serovar Saintpaul str. S-70]|nr:N-methyltryptophan oxidase [Salmonella enterica subsp. enterica serovar Saintpaul str. S-70]